MSGPSLRAKSAATEENKKKYSMHQRELSQVLRNATIDIKIINALKTKHSKAKNGVNGNDQIEKPW